MEKRPQSELTIFALMTELKRITLKPGKDQSIRRFHPWVFSGAIRDLSSFPENGELVRVCADSGEVLGTGHYAEGSIAVRIFSFGDQVINDEFWINKIREAWLLRVRIGIATDPRNEVFRLVNAEGDGLPGLIIDIYGTTAVIQAHDAGMHRLRELWVRALTDVLGQRIERVYDKSELKLSRTSTLPSEDGYLFGSHSDGPVREHGLAFRIDWIGGQKTGFFIDQRENRKLLGEMAAGKKVLNTFCYTGGFSVYALAGGAELVHSLDSSQKAVDLTEENIKLNDFYGPRHQVIKADAVEYLKKLEVDYDIIVLDPPAFAKHLSARHKAVQGYRRINEAAIRQIKPGGILMTFSCSQAVDFGLFRGAVLAASIECRREVRILHQLHQPADHPVSVYHPEGEYLKGLVLQIS
jgi:23S rRNA (cytosine1962-C5)-methyltransferase